MPTQNILEEYLVRLGFTTDTVSYARFVSALRDASSAVDNQYFAMGKTLLGFQAAATSAFAAIGLGAVGIVDKVAMADQQYRLLALHMYTSLPVARELKIALDALGQPLENVMWDPELAARFHQLVTDQQNLTRSLGPGFESQMLKIRDVRFEWTRLGVILQYLTMDLVKDLAQAFGLTMDDMLVKLRGWNDYIISHLPQISEWIVGKLKPALSATRDVLYETLGLGKEFAITFTNLIGSISGDTGLEGTTFSWEKFGAAVQIVTKFLGDFVVSMVHAEEIALHLLSAMADLNSLNFKDMRAELAAAKALLTPGSSAALGAVLGGAAGTALAGPAGGTLGAGIGAAIGYEAGGFTTKESSKVQDTIRSVAGVMGVPPELALAVAQTESGFRQTDAQGNLLRSDKSNSHAMGIFQLQPGTARDMGVNPANEVGNIIGGIKYLKQLLAKFHGNQALALQAYSGGTPGYAERVLAAEGGGRPSGDINITVHATTNASAKQIAAETWKIAEDAMKRRVQRNIGEFQLPGTSY